MPNVVTWKRPAPGGVVENVGAVSLGAAVGDGA